MAAPSQVRPILGTVTIQGRGVFSQLCHSGATRAAENPGYWNHPESQLLAYACERAEGAPGFDSSVSSVSTVTKDTKLEEYF